MMFLALLSTERGKAIDEDSSNYKPGKEGCGVKSGGVLCVEILSSFRQKPAEINNHRQRSF